MPDLIAQGAQRQQRWRRVIPTEHPIVLGRGGSWSVPWDPHISRRHVELTWHGTWLDVRATADARNPVFSHGKQVSHLRLFPGDHFVIGSTTFTLVDQQIHLRNDGPPPITEHTFSTAYLDKFPFRDADQRFQALCRLPEDLLGATGDDDIGARFVNILLAGIPRAAAVALVRREERDAIAVLHWDHRNLAGGEFQPSRRLIQLACDRQESVVHVWNDPRISIHMYTNRANVEWSFCTPIQGDACRGWAIYVAGGTIGDEGSPSTDPEDLRDDLKFAELAGTTLANYLQVELLQRRRASLRPFFSPVVLEALEQEDPETVLAPREALVSVLFCDLRGFSAESERSSGNPLELLRRVSGALGVLTRNILEHGGVVGDFHGDAAMGFWGWPLAHQDGALRACRAALAIRAEFARAAAEADHPLHDFQIGIGIASGNAVAGKIGTADQVKVTVFGHVVNLASRLENMTKVLKGPILIDSATAQSVRDHLVPEQGRLRRVLVARPEGFTRPVEVHELVPNRLQWPQLTDEDLQSYEAALDALQAGDWNAAYELLHRVTAMDRVKDFLTGLIAQYHRTPPADWNGVIAIPRR